MLAQFFRIISMNHVKRLRLERQCMLSFYRFSRWVRAFNPHAPTKMLGHVPSAITFNSQAHIIASLRVPRATHNLPRTRVLRRSLS